jgi:hypothetical protein
MANKSAGFAAEHGNRCRKSDVRVRMSDYYVRCQMLDLRAFPCHLIDQFVTYQKLSAAPHEATPNL